MKDARAILTEWFQSGKRRPLSLDEKKLLNDMRGTEYLRIYEEVRREVERDHVYRTEERK